MRQLKFTAYIPIIFLAFVSCQNKNKTINEICILSEDQINFVYDSNVLLIDARTPESYKKKHYPNSINITGNMVKTKPKEIMKILNENKFKEIVIYCSGNSCDTSNLIAQHLVYTGHKISVYPMGWTVLQHHLDN